MRSTKPASRMWTVAFPCVWSRARCGDSEYDLGGVGLWRSNVRHESIWHKVDHLKPLSSWVAKACRKFRCYSCRQRCWRKDDQLMQTLRQHQNWMVRQRTRALMVIWRWCWEICRNKPGSTRVDQSRSLNSHRKPARNIPLDIAFASVTGISR